MDTINALASFAALSQETRLAAFRLLVQKEPYGLPAGEIARQLSVPHNTLSTHLATLERAGLVISTRQGRTITYRARVDHINEMINFLAHNCCAGHPEICIPLVATDDLCCHTDNQATQTKAKK